MKKKIFIVLFLIASFFAFAEQSNSIKIDHYFGEYLSADYIVFRYHLNLFKDGSFLFVASGGNVDGMASGRFSLDDNKINFVTNSYKGKNVNFLFRQNETFSIEEATSDMLVLKNTNPFDKSFSMPIKFMVD